MVGIDYELDPVVASVRRRSRLEMAGFYQRRRSGIGRALTREEIEDQSPYRLADLFRQIPGAQIISGNDGFEDSVRLRGGCTPIVVLDGLRLGNPIRIDDIRTVNEVEALEVYQGSETPIQYTNITTCGVIMLWTRDPIAEEGAGFSWGRTITVVAIGIAMIFGPR